MYLPLVMTQGHLDFSLLHRIVDIWKGLGNGGFTVLTGEPTNLQDCLQKSLLVAGLATPNTCHLDVLCHTLVQLDRRT